MSDIDQGLSRVQNPQQIDASLKRLRVEYGKGRPAISASANGRRNRSQRHSRFPTLKPLAQGVLTGK